jgi:hypothetical protein
MAWPPKKTTIHASSCISPIHEIRGGSKKMWVLSKHVVLRWTSLRGQKTVLVVKLPMVPLRKPKTHLEPKQFSIDSPVIVDSDFPREKKKHRLRKIRSLWYLPLSPLYTNFAVYIIVTFIIFITQLYWLATPLVIKN